MILREIIEELAYPLKQRKIVNVCVSPIYTAVMLDNQSIGISHTIVDGEISHAGEIVGANAYDIVIENLDSNLQRSVSLAILNSLGEQSSYTQGDPLSLYSGVKLCVFGYTPQVSASNFDTIITYDFASNETRKIGNTEIRPFSTLTKEYCSTAVIFGSTLVNNTIDKIISQVSADHLILTGISSVDAPITLKNYGFEVISKLFSSDKYRVFRIVCEGGNNRALGKYMIRYFRKI
ncbi:hypothetical protein DJ531_05710 [Sulfolobus sp. A20-N-F6]|uniref:Rossmann-like domain-containing protein n=1 Tax=Saccharolobus sp. A20 TaxID=1891280 RepID=UPI00084600F8|nr:DUF364 domain-containing protein [Sulfolobus sp. A20]TRM75079.1 hypothetical protein DJ523_03570 [Sulfolobus sp. E5]TRM76630.1 hypothetical protein DJ532_07005 [Sulfolobus sp. A20-N-F8]TRM79862.1 hypothetical protein DJ524_09330 [Sulfolobus sp. D5]TRM83366.1 hypothetical protein DJ531_05710 [Sulfolobus sp. A20-N-F6]TRM84851.1 hypothetical protein DJ522_03095 [Sulfolobus sp. F3]TRM86851.1 hypothetical protein DJ521_04725 [Sulfolobus sp. E3]TRM87350.1 hypothetical protein DJ529_08815 [Sulfo